VENREGLHAVSVTYAYRITLTLRVTKKEIVLRCVNARSDPDFDTFPRFIYDPDLAMLERHRIGQGDVDLALFKRDPVPLVLDADQKPCSRRLDFLHDGVDHRCIFKEISLYRRPMNSEQMEEIKRYFGVVAESLRSDIRQIAEGHATIRQELQRQRDEFRDEFKEMRALLRLSFSQLDQRIQTLESDMVALKSRMDRLESGRT
jgi:hypothetical protein